MNRFGSVFKPLMWSMALLLAAFVAGCSGGGEGSDGGASPAGSTAPTESDGGGAGGGASPADTTAPTVISTIPADVATGVAINGNITATFNEAMDAATITAATFTLMQGATPVPGAVIYAGTVAILTPANDLAANTVLTVTITTGARDLAGNALAVDKTWSFTTEATPDAAQPTAPGAGNGVGGAGRGPAPIDLQTAGNFVILTQSAITNTPTSAVAGNVGLSAAPGTGIGLTCDEVSGVIYTVDAAGPVPCGARDTDRLNTSVIHAIAAWSDGVARPPDYTDLGAGNIGGLNLGPATYKWSGSVQIATNLTLTGGPNDVWIFLIEHDLSVSAGVQIILDGALPQNVFWLTLIDAVELGAASQFHGVILAETEIFMRTGASINGRLLATNAINLDQNTVTQPAP